MVGNGPNLAVYILELSDCFNWDKQRGPSQVTALFSLADGAGLRLRAVDDGPLLQAAGGERGAPRERQAAGAPADRAVQDAPRHLSLPLQLHLQQEPENQQVGPTPHLRAGSVCRI